MQNYAHIPQLGATIARIRDEAKLTQSNVAKEAGVEQSRLSRIELGTITTEEDFDAVVDALIALKANNAKELRDYMDSDWEHIETPSFWNPERECLERVENTLKSIDAFLKDGHPWPLRNQIEHQKNSLKHGSLFLNNLDHNIAFIGKISAGKSTAISFIFDLLMPSPKSKNISDRPILETGQGGTTLCEVHIKSGKSYELTLLPISDTEMRQSVDDFCSVKWNKNIEGESVSISREMERAIRNMSGLTRVPQKKDGEIIRIDPIPDMQLSCESEDEFRMKVIERMNLDKRTRHNLWHSDSPEKNPMAWMQETFRKVNNGRIPDVPLPKRIELIVPDLEQMFDEFQITVIDTKGIDESAIRHDIDDRLEDPRTMAILCSGFGDMPDPKLLELLQHTKENLTEGKVAILALPRLGEALEMKDDAGDKASTDEEGYALKNEQAIGALSSKGFANVPTLFYNASTDDADSIRNSLFEQLRQMRKSAESKLDVLCETSQHIITNSAPQAMLRAIEEVNKRLSNFIEGNLEFGNFEQEAHIFALKKIGERHHSILWATTRRQGEYSKLSIPHLIGVGARHEADSRSKSWFEGFEMELNSLKQDEGLALAEKVIDQINERAKILRHDFLKVVENRAFIIYQTSLANAPIWDKCRKEWGAGSGYKMRVTDIIKNWLDNETESKDTLENVTKKMWEEKVIIPLQSQVEENESET